MLMFLVDIFWLSFAFWNELVFAVCLWLLSDASLVDFGQFFLINDYSLSLVGLNRQRRGVLALGSL